MLDTNAWLAAPSTLPDAQPALAFKEVDNCGSVIGALILVFREILREDNTQAVIWRRMKSRIMARIVEKTAKAKPVPVMPCPSSERNWILVTWETIPQKDTSYRFLPVWKVAYA